MTRKKRREQQPVVPVRQYGSVTRCDARYVVPEELAGERLDKVVAALHEGLSRAAAATLIDDGHVTVNGRTSKPAARPIAGAQVALSLPPTMAATAQPEHIPLHIVYEDASLVVVDKPAGMVVHPAPGNPSGTLVNALLGRYTSLPGDASRPGIVHRLDKDTSGLLVVARTPQAVSALARAFKQREVDKEYLALVIGAMRPPDGSIATEIGRDPRFRQRMAVVASGGRDARTRYHTEELLAGYSVLRVYLDTGRMHQIRVHFSAAGHPIVGDPVYGRAIRGLGLRRQFLHATMLRFTHPATGETITCTSPLPPDLEAVLARIRELGASRR